MTLPPELKSLTILRKRFTYGTHPRPTRDWLVLITLAALVLLVSLGLQVWNFHALVNGRGSEETSGTALPVNTSTLEQAKAVFEKRAEEAARYRNEYRFVDPAR